MKRLRKRMDLQAKIILVLVSVILPTFVIVTIAENKLTRPLLEDEMKQIGITSAKTLVAEIVSLRLLTSPNPTVALESKIQEVLYAQPNIMRLDVLVRDQTTQVIRTIASNIEEDPLSPSWVPPATLPETITSYRREEEGEAPAWEIYVPIDSRLKSTSQAPKKMIGAIHVVVTLRLISNLTATFWKTTATAASVSMLALVLGLSFFLRKTIANDRKLRLAETANVQLTEQLHETQRQLMNTEKLAVMGQLTGRFAHEIGTPLNAIGGHLQLLREETSNGANDRFEIINGQVSKIEQIVKNFLQSTAKPASQRQLADLNQLADKTLGIVQPRVQAMGVEVKRQYERDMGPLRVVPLELEQILLNLINNSLDGLKSKAQSKKGKLSLEVATRASVDERGGAWAELSVYDTGEGISKTDLKNVLKPFFTTKKPGEGTGLGLTISQELAKKYGGVLEVDSREGVWTRVTLKIPFETEKALAVAQDPAAQVSI